MSVLQVQEPPVHDYCVIAVPEEKIKEHLSDIDVLKSNKNEYTVIDTIQCHKGEMIPSILLLLSAGTYINDKDIWNAYKKSQKLIFFLCKKTKTESSMNS